MADRLPFSGEQYWNAISRNAFPGARLYTYTSLSRTTLKATFTDAGAGTPHSNPVIADANGLFDAIYGTGAYFIDIYNTDDTILIYQEDEVFGAGGSGLDNITTTVSLIADLRVVDTTTFQSAFVEGETAINDGGQGRFYFDATSVAIDNGTTIIAPTVGSGRWLILNVETLAIGDDAITTPKIIDEAVTVDKLSWMPFSSKDGLEMSNGSSPITDIDISSGRVADSTQSKILNLSPTTKEINNDWAEGSGGGFPTGITLTNNVWYRFFVIAKPDGTTDAGFDTSATATNLLSDAAGYTLFRRVGWVHYFLNKILLWSASVGGEYVFQDQLSITKTVLTSSQTSEMIAPPNSKVKLSVSLSDSNTNNLLITEVSQTDTVPTSSFKTIDTSSASSLSIAEINRNVDSSSEIRYRATSSSGVFKILFISWTDNIELS